MCFAPVRALSSWAQPGRPALRRAPLRSLRPARLGHRGDPAVASPTPRHHPSRVLTHPSLAVKPVPTAKSATSMSSWCAIHRVLPDDVPLSVCGRRPTTGSAGPSPSSWTATTTRCSPIHAHAGALRQHHHDASPTIRLPDQDRAPCTPARVSRQVPRTSYPSPTKRYRGTFSRLVGGPRIRQSPGGGTECTTGTDIEQNLDKDGPSNR